MRWIPGTKAVAVAILTPAFAWGYSVLSHEAIIDATWEPGLRAILAARYPGLSDVDLRKAHAYAYGGAIVQDLGYYPFGSHQFSDLVHYVRSGDFILNLLAEARDANEFAFALGALAHYASDNNGHPMATNPAVALMYPKLRRKYGPVITYEDNPTDHLRVEFAFDVAQVAKGRYASKDYHDFIGFEVAKDLLDRAFERTYGIRLKDAFASVDLALGTYRRTVSSIIPEMTKAAWDAKKSELTNATPGLTREKFVYNLSRSSYEKEWGSEYEKPGPGARFLSFLFRIMPKIGPFKALAFKPPTPEAEKLFMKSFNTTLDQYRALLARVRAHSLRALPDRNFDTGKPSRAGEYRMADEAACKLLDKLADKKFERVDNALRANLLQFYGDKRPEDPKAAAALDSLRAAQLPNASTRHQPSAIPVIAIPTQTITAADTTGR
jgi:hypothetical protein